MHFLFYYFILHNLSFIEGSGEQQAFILPEVSLESSRYLSH
jgi:hypothetical protein